MENKQEVKRSRKSILIAIAAMALMMSPFPMLGPASAENVEQALIAQEDLIKDLPEEEKQAFVDHYLGLIVRDEVALDDTPGAYPEYDPQLQLDLTERIVEALKVDPQFGPTMLPENAGPALGLSTEEDPLVGPDGTPVTQEMVDETYQMFIYGLIFAREEFVAELEKLAEETMRPEGSEDATPEPETPDESQQQDTVDQIRANITEEVMGEWASQDPDAVPPASFDITQPEVLETIGIPDFAVPTINPVELDEVPVFPQPDSITPPELLDVTADMGDFEMPALDAPPMLPSPTEMGASIPNSPFSAIPQDVLDQADFRLELPQLLEFLRGLALEDVELAGLLGLVDDTVVLPEKIEGRLDAFPEMASKIEALDITAAAFAARLAPLEAPEEQIDPEELPVPQEILDVVDELRAEASELRYVGEVNGRAFEGTWGAPQFVDVDEDGVMDLLVQMTLETVIGDLTGEPVGVQPRFVVERINGYAPELPEAPEMPPLPELPTMEEVLADPMSAVEITEDQLDVAGIETPEGLPELEEPAIPDPASLEAPEAPGEPEFPETPAAPDVQMGQAFPFHLTVAFYPPDSDELVFHDIQMSQADHVNVLLSDMSPSVDFGTVGASGAFALVTAVLRDATLDGDVASLSVSGDQAPARLAVRNAIDAGAGVASLHITPAVPMDLDVTTWHRGATDALSLAASSEGMPVFSIVSDGAEFDITSVPGTSVGVARQEATAADTSRFTQRGLVAMDMARETTFTVLEDGISFDTSARGASFQAIAGFVSDGAYEHATWTAIADAGRRASLTVEDDGVTFDSEVHAAQVSVVNARSAAAALQGAAAGFRITDDLTAFGLPGIKEAAITPTTDASFDIETLSDATTAFLLDVARTGANGLETQQFYFSNLPGSLAVDLRPESINIGGNELVDSLVGQIERPLDGAGAPSTKALAYMEQLDGQASIAMDQSNVNVMSAGGLEEGAVLASNVVDQAGDHVFMAAAGNHMLAEVEGAARQHSAKVTGMASLGDGVGGIISGLTGGVGGIDIDMQIDGPLCWSLGTDSSRLELCVSNVPQHINLDMELVPSPKMVYTASEEIAEIAVRLIADQVNIEFFIHGLPEVVSLLYERGGMVMETSDRIDAVGVIAQLMDTTIALGVEDLPTVINFAWGEGGMGPGIPVGDAIGRVYATVSRPGLGIFFEIVHLPAMEFDWSNGAMDLNMFGDRIQSISAQLFLAGSSAANNLQAYLQITDLPGFSANWDTLGGGLSTDGPLGGIEMGLLLGPSWRPTLSLLVDVQDVPQIGAASWTDTSFDLPLIGGRIGSATFQFLAGDITLFLQAVGVPGMHAAWGPDSGVLSTDGRLDRITALFQKGTAAPLIRVFFQIEGVPQLDGIRWGDSMAFDFADGRIDRIVFDFLSDQRDDALDIRFFLEATDLPGFVVDPVSQTIRTSDAMGYFGFTLMRGRAWAPSMLVDFSITGVPQIKAGSWASGLSLGFEPANARIQAIEFLFLLDEAGTANDLYARLAANGVPGILLDTAGTFSTAARLDLLSLDFRAGRITDPAALLQLNIRGVPQITGGGFGSGGINLGIAPGQAIDQVSFYFRLLTPRGFGGTDELLISLVGIQIPGIAADMGTGSGISTTGTLGRIQLHFHNGLRGAPFIAANLDIQNVPRIVSSGWSKTGLAFNTVGKIGSIYLDFDLDLTGSANDVFMVAQARGVPGINVGFNNGGGTISTTDSLDLISLNVIVGPRHGLNLAGNGIDLAFQAVGIPRITSGGWSDGGFALGMAGRITSILFEFIVNEANNANDVYLRLSANGVPGINMGFGTNGGSLSTTGTLGALDAYAILGPRSGLNLAGTGVYLHAGLSNVPRIYSGGWSATGMDLNMGTQKIGHLGLLFWVNQPGAANDLLLSASANGVPTLSVAKTSTGFGLNAPRGIDSISLLLQKGPYGYNPATAPIFVGAFLRPDGYGTPYGGNALFSLAAQVSGLKSVSWAANTGSKTQTLGLGFTRDLDARAILNFQTSALTALADITVKNLPATMNIVMSPDVTSFTSSRLGGGGGTPWLQGTVDIGTTGAANSAPAPYWPWQTATDSAGKCYRSGYGWIACGIMGNTFIDMSNGGLASKWKLDFPLPTSFSFSKSTANGVPSYSLNSGGVKIGKLDVRVGTKFPLPVWPYQLNLMAVGTISNLPTSMSISQSMGSSGSPTIDVNTAQSIKKIFVGVRTDGNWYGNPDAVWWSNSNVNSAGFPLFAMIRDVPTSVHFATGKSSYTDAACSGCNPALPFFSYSANANTLDAAAFVDIGYLWNTFSRTAIQAAGSSMPNWLRSLASYNADGHLLLDLQNIPRDGISLYKSGNTFVVDPSPYYGYRLGKFFADFELKFSDGVSKSGCLLCTWVVDFRAFYYFNWWFGIETLSLLLEDLGRMAIDPGFDSRIDIDGKLLLHFRAGAGFNAGAGVELYLVGIKILCVCIYIPTISVILDPGFISFQVLNWASGSIDYFWLGSPFHRTGSWSWFPAHGHFCWCDWHYWVRVRGTYPGNWGIDSPIAVPPYVPFRGLKVQYGNNYHALMNPRINACVGSWENPTAFCWEIGRLIPTELVVAYAVIKYTSFWFETGSTHHHH